MLRPMTKISPIIRIAAPTPWRTNGSPARAMSRLSALASSLSLVKARPITSPQVAVLTKAELARPLCERQSPSPSLSAIRLSAVSGSGTRRKASASESKATPSWVLRRYSWRNWLTQPRACAERRSPSIASAFFSTRARDSESSAASRSNGASTSGSGARWRRRISSRAVAVASAIFACLQHLSLAATRP